MKVTLINHTQGAVELLLFTKATRLNMSAGLMAEIEKMPPSKKLEELEYMANTIKSSWEFIDVVFLIEGVSRSTAQQITRTRNASYAMQSQRVTDVREMEIINPFNEDEDGESWHQFEQGIKNAKRSYGNLVDEGSKLEDARGILPMATSCNLVAKYNLRAFTDLVKARSSLRVQGEYSDIVKEMKLAVLKVWPWSETFFKNEQEQAIKLLEKAAIELGITVGSGVGWDISKAIDLLRK